MNLSPDAIARLVRRDGGRRGETGGRLAGRSADDGAAPYQLRSSGTDKHTPSGPIGLAASGVSRS
jgi:hypothetical protein